MKNIIFIAFIISLATMSCKAQHIIPVEKVVDYHNREEGLLGNKDYVYVKDINKLLNKYVGIWKGKHNSMNYEFKVIKITDDRKEVKEDMLLIRYKITDSSGKELVNTLNLPNNNKYVIKGSYLTKYGGYALSYIGFNSKCGQNGSVFISVKNNKMRLGLHVRGEINPEKCKNRAVEQILPTKGGMELVKK